MSSNRPQNLAKLMEHFVQKIIAMDRAEKICYGVTLTQASTIAIVSEKGMLTMNELSQQLGLALSTLTRIINILVRDEIVCRNHHETDRRKINVCLTDKGKELAEKLKLCSANFWEQVFSNLPADRRKDIVEDLSLLLTALEQAGHTCCRNNKK